MGSHASSGDSVFGGRRGRRPYVIPALRSRNYSKGSGRVEKPRRRQGRSRKIDIDVMLLSTWRSQDVDLDAEVPRVDTAERPSERKPTWRFRDGMGGWVA